MILGLLLASPPTLSFEARAEPMSVVVARLAETTKTPLLCAPDVGKRRVIAVIRNAEIKDIRAKLAEAVGADWVETPKGLRLEITPKLRSAALARHREIRQAWADRALALIGALPERPWTAEEVKKTLPNLQQDPYGLTVSNTPASRAVRRILHSIGSSTLADIQWGETRYFSTLPGGRYLTSLTPSARKAVQTFNVEADVLQQVVLENPNLPKQPGVGSPVTSGQQIDDRVRVAVSDITFSITRSAYRPELTVAIFMSSPAGTMPNGSHLNLNPSPPPISPGPATTLRRELGSIKLELPKEVLEYHAFRRPKAKPPADAPITFRNPERYEPLEMIYGGAARALAEKKGWNVVLQVGDSDFADYSSIDDASPLSELFAEDGGNVSTGSNWLVVGAKDQVETDGMNLDRSVFGAYTRSLITQGYSSAIAFLPVARATNGLEDHPLITMVHRALRLERLSSEGNPSPSKLLFYSALPAQSFRGRVENLSPNQRAALDAYILTRPRNRFFNLTPPEGTQPFDRLDSLPNLAFPNGLTNDLVVDLTVDDEEVAFRAPVPDQGLVDHMPWPAKYLSQIPVTPGSAPPRFRMGRQIRYLLKVEAPGNRTFTDGMSVLLSDLSKPAVELSQLPEAFRRQGEAKKNGGG